MGSTVARLCHWSNVFQLKLGFRRKVYEIEKNKKCWKKVFSGIVDVPIIGFVGKCGRCDLR